jgi:thiol-disulfide isomerase/thioredoxin
MFQIPAALIALSSLALVAAPGAKDCPLCDSSKKQAKADSCCSSSESDCSDAKSCCAVSDADYENAAWPAHNENLYSNDFQGQTLPVALGSETWLTEEVETQGKVIVLDFWATWCGPCIAASPTLDELQKEHKDQLAVLAISGQNDPLEEVRSYVENNPVAYAHLYDADQSVFTPFESRGIPLVVVMSTDGVVRWIGNPHDENFVPAVKKTIASDPMVNAQAQAQAQDETPAVSG